GAVAARLDGLRGHLDDAHHAELGVGATARQDLLVEEWRPVLQTQLSAVQRHVPRPVAQYAGWRPTRTSAFLGFETALENPGGQPVDAGLVLFRPIALDAFIADAGGPVVELLALADVVEERHRHAAGGLHQVDIEDEDLPGAGQGWEACRQARPLGITAMHR